MPRNSRRMSARKTYHVMIRGNERKELFLDDDDRSRFISTLILQNREHKFAIYAYCLMDNHVHLIINEGEDLISRIMQRLQVSYAYYFNKKYGRIGHLFQDRFKSEVIENDQYLLMAIRYIHQNPVKARMVNNLSEYCWSSYNHYLGNADRAIKHLVDIEPILLMFSKNTEQAIRLFADFSNQKVEDVFIDYPENQDLDKEIKTESEAKRYITEFLDKWNVKLEELSSGSNKTPRNELILELKHRSNLSNRQIAMLLRVGRNVVQRLE